MMKERKEDIGEKKRKENTRDSHCDNFQLS